jgi:thiamine biosynthesis lipoprotein
MVKRLHIAALAALVLGACSRSAPTARTEFVLGTVCSVRIYQHGKDAVYGAVFTRLREIEELFSANMEGTAIAEINRLAGVSPVAVPDEVIAVLRRALMFAEFSGGAFDPTIGALVRLWRIGFDDARVPSASEIEAALPLVDWRGVVIDSEAGTVFLEKPGMALDLGGIVKGYAAVEAVRIAREAGVRGALIDLGGNIAVFGVKAAGPFGKSRPWKIGVQHPGGERGEFVGYINTEGGALVTSGGYERFLDEGGRRYHHILSTKTGYPVENELLSVTIVTEGELSGMSAMDADALSTALFALGYAEGSAFLSRIPGPEAVFVLKTGEVRTTQALRGRFKAMDK